MAALYKYFTVSIIIVSLFAHSIGNIFFVADYYLNPAKYEKNCVNKSRPELKCNGKCQLAKKIQAEEKKEKENGEKELASRINITLYNKDYFASIDHQGTICQPIQPEYNNTLKLRSFTSTVFHPPS